MKHVLAVGAVCTLVAAINVELMWVSGVFAGATIAFVTLAARLIAIDAFIEITAQISRNADRRAGR